jgi:DnaJ-class molecular chaperone
VVDEVAPYPTCADCGGTGEQDCECTNVDIGEDDDDEVCDDCNGAGWVDCTTCGGLGYVEPEKENAK